FPTSTPRAPFFGGVGPRGAGGCSFGPAPRCRHEASPARSLVVRAGPAGGGSVCPGATPRVARHLGDPAPGRTARPGLAAVARPGDDARGKSVAHRVGRTGVQGGRPLRARDTAPPLVGGPHTSLLHPERLGVRALGGQGRARLLVAVLHALLQRDLPLGG